MNPIPEVQAAPQQPLSKSVHAPRNPCQIASKSTFSLLQRTRILAILLANFARRGEI
jgi:hypothetical protein